jgi:hypothetical protein
MNKDYSFYEQQLAYDPDTGLLWWKPPHTGRRRNKDRPVGTLRTNSSGTTYVMVGVGKNMIQAHVLAWLLHYKEYPEHEVDHINGVGYDNRIVNLRKATHAENSLNGKVRRDNSSGVTGVSFCRRTGKWFAAVRVNRRMKFIGRFTRKEDAIKARIEAERQYYGEFSPADSRSTNAEGDMVDLAVYKEQDSQKGVVWDKQHKKFRVVLIQDKRKKHIGRYRTLEEALEARDKALEQGSI